MVDSPTAVPAPRPGVPTVGVVGLGLIGGAITRLLTGHGLCVVGYDTEPAGPALVDWADSHSSRFTLTVDLVELTGCDVVFLCTPTDVTTRLLQEGTLPPGDGLLLDVCSVKTPVVAAAEANRDVAGRFVGAHPLAGKATSGFAASDATVLAGQPWVLTPTSVTNPTRVGAALKFLTNHLGPVSVTSPASHDETVAVTSGLTHVFGQALERLAGHSPDLSRVLAGPSFRDATRVVRGSATFPAELVWANRHHVQTQVTTVIEDLINLFEALSGNTPETLRSWFTQIPDTVPQTETIHVPVPVTTGDVTGLIRRGESGFTVTGVHAGNMYLSRRPTREPGEPERVPA